MTRPNPIAIVALCIVALSVLAFTLNEEFGKKKQSSLASIATSKNSDLIAPLVAYNPPHGQPGHRHDLPDGAPLPNSLPATTIASNNTNTTSNLLPASATAVNASHMRLNPEHGKPGHICGVPVGAPLDSVTIAKTPKETTTTTNATAAGLNPAHGQPGHRCDIAVGAPLNSTAAKPNTTTTPTISVPGNGLNPKHGEPGHRCDIAVGAPLNSPPANKSNTTTTATTTPSLNSSLFPTYNFPNKDSASLPAPVPAGTAPQFQYDSTGAALNPPHGQPGHDCAIPVGKPLKKK